MVFKKISSYHPNLDLYDNITAKIITYKKKCKPIYKSFSWNCFQHFDSLDLFLMMLSKDVRIDFGLCKENFSWTAAGRLKVNIEFQGQFVPLKSL